MRLKYRQHAIQRMFERGIREEDIQAALTVGEIVENYPDDTPYPSTLLLGYAGTRPLHIVCADNVADKERIIITVYQPDPVFWKEDWKTRREK